MESIIFASLAEMRQYISATPRRWADMTSSDEISDHRDKFAATHTMQEADTLMAAGYADAVKRMQAAGLDIPAPKAQCTRRTFAPTGYAPSVARYIQGHPCNMIRNTSTPEKAHKVLKMYVNTTYSYTTTDAEILEMGIALLEALKEIEMAGYRVNLYATVAECKRRTGAADLQIATRIKTDGEPLNLSRVSYALAHPSFLRRHMFAVMERAKTHLGDCYGYMADYQTQPGEKAINIALRYYIGNPCRLKKAIKLQLDNITL